MLKWTQEAIGFMRDASEYHRDYYEQLSEQVLKSLPDRRHICDAGCGTGYLSLSLSPFCEKVTAVDLSRPALELLRENVSERQLTNISVQCGDISKLPPEQRYSGMVFCYFGRTPAILRIAREQCNGTLVIITRNYSHHRFTMKPTHFERDTVEASRSFLDREGIAYRWEPCNLEFGQPFRSLEAAEAFFKLYNADEATQLTRAQVEGCLVETGRKDFPLYLPELKKMGIFTVQTADIPDTKEEGI